MLRIVLKFNINLTFILGIYFHNLVKKLNDKNDDNTK